MTEGQGISSIAPTFSKRGYNQKNDTIVPNDPEVLHKQDLANTVDPDQPNPGPEGAVWSGSPMFVFPSASFEYITLQ